MISRLRQLLESPRSPWVAALVALVLCAPTLGGGLFLDDLPQRAFFAGKLEGFLSPRGDWDLFNFQGPDRGHLRTAMDHGFWPWWTPPDYRLAFLRPLASLLHALDYHTWPDSPWLMHLESVVLFAAIVVFAALLYRRRVSPPWAAGVAALFFAADDAHAMVVSWIANRNAVLAGVFGFAALFAHASYREERSRPAAVAAPLLFALGMASGESALATTAYLFAHAVFLDEGKPVRRLLTLAPYAAVAVAWAAVYRGLGYGAVGGGFYIDPISEPAAFLEALTTRVPILLLSQFGPVPAELWAQGVDVPVSLWLVVAGSLIFLGYILHRAIGRDRAAGYFATGMLLSLVPFCATWPHDRLLLFPGFGAFGLVALFLSRSGAVAGRAPRFFARSAAVILVFLHGIAAPILLPVKSVWLASTMRDYLQRAERSLPRDLAGGKQTLVVIAAPDSLVTSNGMAERLRRGEPAPRALRLLSVHTLGEMRLSRVDERTLSMTLSEGFLHDPFSMVFRSPAVPFRAGEIIDIAGMQAEVAEVLPDGRPRRVLFRFDVPLESPELRWVRWDKTRFVLAAPPRPGEDITMPATDWFTAIRGG